MTPNGPTHLTGFNYRPIYIDVKPNHTSIREEDWGFKKKIRMNKNQDFFVRRDAN